MFWKWIRIIVPSQRGTKSLSQTFSLTVPIRWNDLTNSIRAAESLPILGCFHTSTFGALPGSIDVRVRFVWMRWTLSSVLGCAPANRTRIRLKRVIWGTVHVNSSTVHYWCEYNRSKSRKWTTINDVFDKNVCLCLFHSLSWWVWLTRC